jgi:glycogen debranching enzyme
MRITVNSGTTFLICDDLGNIAEGTELGLYHEDTRFLSAYELTLDGQSPLLLTAQATGTSASAHFLTNPGLPTIPRGQLSIIRRRQIVHGMREEIEITNYGEGDAVFTLQLCLETDFCHIFEVKNEVWVSREDPLRGGVARRESAPDGREHRYVSASGLRAQTLFVRLSSAPQSTDGQFSFALTLAPRQTWRFTIDFIALDGQPLDGRVVEQEAPAGAVHPAMDHRVRDGKALHERYRRYQEHLIASAPELETDSQTLRRAYRQSVHDFAALQIWQPDAASPGALARKADDDAGDHEDDGEFVIAAGIPWFMTLFGRDSLITAYQTLPFFPAAASATLRALARLQGTHVDRLRAEEPGKILHEHRSPSFNGARNSPAIFPYYGTIDATPLFLKLLADLCRVTGDLTLARELRGNAIAALDWMARYGDRDGDGYLEYLCDAETGLENQGWKDSGDALRFRDGRLARGPIALCEAQGYAYAAQVGMAEVFAALGEDDVARLLRAEAAALKVRFNRDFWMDERGCFALALEGEKRQVDALTSNAGQLLWTGIADTEKARAVAAHLVSPEFFSGWGVRTMATSEGGYNPISYHNGSVWPHDTSLIVAGLARYEYVEEARRIVAGMLAALDHSHDGRLPELFAGYSATEVPFPVDYPTACRPQAWAAGSVFLLLSVMAGADAGASHDAHVAFVPETIDYLRLRGVWVQGQRTEREARRGDEVAVLAHDASGAVSRAAQ